jgi:hypothetical protein
MIETPNPEREIVLDYRERVKFTVENLDVAYDIGNYQYCVLVLRAVIDIGNQIHDYETVALLEELLEAVLEKA